MVRMKNRMKIGTNRLSCSRMPRRTRYLSGAVAVELAVLLIPMLILLGGSVDIARSMYYYNALVKSVRDATRLLSQHNPTDSGYPAAAARCLAVYGNADCTGPKLVEGLDTGMVVICDRISSPTATPSAACAGGTYADVGTGSGTINLVQVRVVGYTFSFLLPILPTVTNIPFADVRSTMRQVL